MQFNIITNVLKPEIVHYLGFELRYTPNGDYWTCLIYKGDDFKGGTFDKSLDNCLDKATKKIESGKYNSR